jgi:hypothetical protein
MPALGGPLNCVTPPRLRVIARRLAWLVPLTLLPLAGAWGLHSLKAYAAQRSTAALQLQKLGGDLNSTSAAMACPRRSASPPRPWNRRSALTPRV